MGRSDPGDVHCEQFVLCPEDLTSVTRSCHQMDTMETPDMFLLDPTPAP